MAVSVSMAVSVTMSAMVSVSVPMAMPVSIAVTVASAKVIGATLFELVLIRGTLRNDGRRSHYPNSRGRSDEKEKRKRSHTEQLLRGLRQVLQ
ncbi:hypothetical protein H4R33_006530 [Dimargaris cristalligena]|nr:hypothetical protein H4R33_006530 [Dimargaris cristalligena]